MATASQEGAPAYFDRAVEMCRRAGFKDVLLRGDTAFCTTLHFDRWTKDGIRFVFGYDAVSQLVETAETLTQEEYSELVRKADDALDERQRRAKQPRGRRPSFGRRATWTFAW
ncbi:MAG: hypothetical protein IPG04_40275 [Polyangiaceae bacterium]|nr:hypothetical protein [Polyangiaceae bacterium]